MNDEIINDEVDQLIDTVADRLKRGVSTERLLNNGETRQICMAVVKLREDNGLTELTPLCDVPLTR